MKSEKLKIENKKRQPACKEVEESSSKNKRQNVRKLQIDWQQRSVRFNTLALRTTHSGIYRSFVAYTYRFRTLISCPLIYTCVYIYKCVCVCRPIDVGQSINFAFSLWA